MLYSSVIRNCKADCGEMLQHCVVATQSFLDIANWDKGEIRPSELFRQQEEPGAA